MRIETARLVLRQLEEGDAGFILELVNNPDWLRFIGDRGVRSLGDARCFIAEGPRAMYAEHGVGLLAVESREGAAALGICGLLARDSLPEPDLGFAFLPQHRAQGYATEAAAAVLAHARDTLHLPRILAITDPDNQRSIRLLEKLGFRFEGPIKLPGDPQEISLYAVETSPLDP